MKIEDKRNHAWIGDAVLALYARKWILRQSSIAPKERADVFQSMTSNEFLSHWGEPTQVESEIGLLFEKEGLEKTMQYLEENFLPIVLKRQARKKQPGRHQRKNPKC